MLKISRVIPSKSAFGLLNGKHDNNSHPFYPLGCAIEMYVVPSKRKTWGEHTKSRFYIGTSWDHYRYHEVWIKDTKTSRVDQMVFSSIST